MIGTIGMMKSGSLRNGLCPVDSLNWFSYIWILLKEELR
jgi:hypothetical protein